jgi:hypothetical protein
VVASACREGGLGAALLRVARPSGGGPVGARVGSRAARHGPDFVLVACRGVTPHVSTSAPEATRGFQKRERRWPLEGEG